jgi:putative SOS response-associated peptidase YedK
MCGRYTITETPQKLAERFRADLFEGTFPPHYNAAPTQLLPVIIQDDAGTRRVVLMRWGLIPSWADDAAIGNRMINARAETLSSKPSFREAFKKRRCLVPADGFYEWQKLKGRKTPVRVTPQARRIFAFAGLWERWKGPDGDEVLSFTIVTTEANVSVRPLHDRMPLVIEKEREDRWLDPKTPIAELNAMLQRPVAEPLDLRNASPRVNSPSNDDPSLLEP